MLLEEVQDRPAGTLAWADSDFEWVVEVDDWDVPDPIPPAVDPRVTAKPTEPVEVAVAELRRVDAAMARLLRAMAEAGPADGWPADRLIGLEAQATGWDVAFLQRCVQVLGAMPALWLAFDRGMVSWSQLRGVVTAAKALSVADRGRLDDQLRAVVAQNASAEPEQLVETAADLTGRLDDERMRDRERAQQRGSFLHLQARLFGGVDIHGHVNDLAGAVIADAVHAAADAPVEDDPEAGRDADGRPVPGAWGPPTVRAAQLAEGLERVCAAYLTGESDGASSTTTVVLDITDLTDLPELGEVAAAAGTTATRDPRTAQPGTDHARQPAATTTAATRATGPAAQSAATDSPAGGPRASDRVDPIARATARLLWRLGSGRLPLSTARIHALTCDSAFVPVLTDGDTPIAIGDAHDPIPKPIRRAARARDQGCRFPGCRAPAVTTDLHHIIPRIRGGPTALHNLVSLCRRHHSMISQPGWHLTLHDDGTLIVRRGRYRHTSRPRLRPAHPDQPVNR